jgi:hypothetical protein
MTRLRRAIALCMAFLLAQLLVAGSGYACALMGPMDGQGVHAAPGMMATPAGAADASCPDAMPSAPERGHAPDSSPCPLPWAPAGCRGAPCAPATAPATAAQAVGDALRDATERPTLAVLPLPSVVRAPELPPPRA